jgi:predicted enzyme related to lactoylglutathione lyase
MSDHGRFIWYELITPDMAGAKRFYGDVVGWTAQDLPMPDGGGEPYAILSSNGAGVAGMMNRGEAMKDMPPNWTGYICVDDCDAAAAKVKGLGGSVMNPPMDIPGIGRFAVVADPAGAVFAIMKPIPPQGGEPPRRDMSAPGQCGWHELYGGDPDKGGFDFYAQMFGWTKSDAMPMGDMGTYQLFNNQDGQVGGMMRKPENIPMPNWGYYFRVPDIEAAAATIKAGGGQVLNGPMDVPGDDRIINGLDPQGAQFSVVAKKG